MVCKDNKLLAFVTLNHKENSQSEKQQKKTVKFQIPFSGFSLPDFNFSAFNERVNEHVVWPTSSQISVPNEKARLLRIKSYVLCQLRLFALEWKQL